jgi:RHS repeat-associated protein
MTTTDTTGSHSANYTYDAIGNTATRPTATAGTQTMTWDAERHAATAADSTGTTSYLYDAGGNRLIRRDPVGKTLYLPMQELRYNTGTGAETATRYYTYTDSTIAVRTAAGLTWLSSDQQGTSQIAMDAVHQTAAIRRETPFGTIRATTGTWSAAMDKGFVGGTNDNTGLTHLGAREYDPTTGRFISRDPIVDVKAPQQMNGYTYADGNATTLADPSGLDPCPDGGMGCHYDGTDNWQQYLPPGLDEPTGNGTQLVDMYLSEVAKAQTYAYHIKLGAALVHQGDPQSPIPQCNIDPGRCISALGDLERGDSVTRLQASVECGGNSNCMVFDKHVPPTDVGIPSQVGLPQALGVCVSGSAAFGVSVGADICIVADSKGWGLVLNGSGGVSPPVQTGGEIIPGASISGGVLLTNTPDMDNLKGPFGFVSGSAGSYTATESIGHDLNGNPVDTTYIGKDIWGVSLLGAAEPTLGGGVSNTCVFRFNRASWRAFTEGHWKSACN